MSPLKMGRESLVVPKIPAQIPDTVQIDASWHAHAERCGLVFFEMEVTDVQLTSIPRGPPMPWMGWKYIPRIDGPGPDVSYPTLIESGGKSKRHG